MKTPTVQILYPLNTEDEQLIPRTKCSSAIILYLRITILVSTQNLLLRTKDLSFVNGSHHCQTFLNRQTKQKYWSHS